MNRRGFFARTLGALAASVLPVQKFVAPTNPWRYVGATDWNGPLTYRGVPLVFDEHCPPGTAYFLNPNSYSYWIGPPSVTRQGDEISIPMRFVVNEPLRLGVITGITT